MGCKYMNDGWVCGYMGGWMDIWINEWMDMDGSVSTVCG